MKTKFVEVLNEEIRREFMIRIDKVIIHCEKCGKSWGFSLWDKDDQKIPARSLVCESCLADERMEV